MLSLLRKIIPATYLPTYQRLTIKIFCLRLVSWGTKNYGTGKIHANRTLHWSHVQRTNQTRRLDLVTFHSREYSSPQRDSAGKPSQAWRPCTTRSQVGPGRVRGKALTRSLRAGQWTAWRCAEAEACSYHLDGIFPTRTNSIGSVCCGKFHCRREHGGRERPRSSGMTER